MPDNESATSYDKVPYRSAPLPQTHPSRVGAIAQLFGMGRSLSTEFRVLELGCASGGNLIPLAQEYPHARFVGIDSSRVQIEQGQQLIRSAELNNIELISEGIEKYGTDDKFDYIICHGVFSWVPPNVQEAIFKVCQQFLREDGLAYVSYNTFPGWKMRGTIRDIMRYRSRSFETHEDQLGQARTFLEFLTKSLGDEGSPYALMLKRELEAIGRADDYYLHHEHLEDTNQPLYFHKFMEQASKYGLSFLCEADFGSSYIEKLPDPIRSMVISVSQDRIELEQYLDFLRNRTFRQSILCHSSQSTRRQPSVEQLNGLYISSNAIPESAGADLRSRDELLFRRREARLKTTDPLVKVAFNLLEKRWPQRVAFNELASMSRSMVHDRPIPIDHEFMTSETQRFAKTILDCFSSTLVDLHCDQSRCDAFPGEHPLANPLQMSQAREGSLVTTLLHTETSLDEFQRQVALMSDGARSRSEIVDRIVERIQQGTLTIYGSQGSRLEATEETLPHVTSYVNRTIDGLWKNGMLAFNS